MTKKAIIYDKWLPSLGGGEVVAGQMARILRDNGYEVTFITRKYIPLKTITKALNIDLKGVKFAEVWNDQAKLRNISLNKDIFINVSFWDYSFGYAKKNIYFTHFPSRPYSSICGWFINMILLPFLSNFIHTKELIEGKVVQIHNQIGLEKKGVFRIAFFYLKPKQIYMMSFSLHIQKFYKSILESLRWEITDSEILDAKVTVDHHHSVLHFRIKFIAASSTIYLKLRMNYKDIMLYQNYIYIINEKIIPPYSNFIPLGKYFYKRVQYRLRAGIFLNVIERLKTYSAILANSKFTKKWIKKYWHRDAIVLYPPVELLFNKYDVLKEKKKPWICSVGRFFTLGHGKKQEIMIEAFKKIYKKESCWELHLIGGLGDEPTSIEFAEFLKQKSEGYPIFFHFNISKKRVEEFLVKSEIYWHATGYNEDEEANPIKFEHFGISVIESLSAACIPVLFDGGGLKEIVNVLDLDPSKYLFKTKEELIEKTIYQIKKGKNSIPWETVFKKLDNTFSLNTFTKNFLKIVENA